MADYSALKATIDNNVNTNGQQAITGAILNDVLNEMVDVLGDGVIRNENPAVNDLAVSVLGDDVTLKIKDAPATLDTIVYEGMSYRDIFETNNVISFPAGFEGGLGTYTASAGSPAITTDEADSGTHSLKCSGTTSQQIKSPANATGKAWIASRVKITSWTSGYCGVQYGSGGATNHDGGVSGVTDGWVTKVGRKDDGSPYYVYIGSFLSANLTGYVDTPVIIFDNIFTNVPSEDLFTEMYNTYCDIKRGDPAYDVRTLHLEVQDTTTYPAQNCKDAFLSKMNAKASLIGATTAVFTDASGLLYSGSASSAKDILQILVHASGIRGIAEKWNKASYSMDFKGPSSRIETIITSVASGTFTYPILGGKTGTLTASGNVNYNLALVTQIAGKECAIVVLGDTTDAKRWSDAQAIAVYLETILNGGTATLSVNAPCVCGCLLPSNPIMYDNFAFDLLASKAPTTLRLPASLTKLMTLITAYDYITDENELVTIDSSDLIGGSGSNLVAGDKVSIRDLVYDMLLPSSNDAATALARHLGRKILAS